MRVTVDTVVAFGAAVLAERAVCRVLVVVVVVEGAVVESVAGAALVSGATGVASVTGGGAGCVTTGAGSVVTGCVAWASKGVDESARAAAIAGRALVRAKCMVLIIIRDNRALGPSTHDYRSADR